VKGYFKQQLLKQSKMVKMDKVFHKLLTAAGPTILVTEKVK